MADDRDTLAILAEELGFALQPLTAAFSSADALRDFLEELGWDFAAAPAALESLRTALLQAERVTSEEVPDLLNRVRAAFESISNLGSAGGLANDFKNEFPRQLVDYLLVEWLLRHQPRFGYLLLAFGIIRLEEKPAAGGRPAYVRRTFAFEDLGSFFNDPLVFFKNGYRWGRSDFDGERLIQALDGLFDAWGWHTRPQLLDPDTVNQLAAGAIDPADVSDLSLRLVLVEHSTDAERFGAGVGLFLLPETAADKPGFALLPYAQGSFEEDIEIADNLALGFKGGLDLAGGLGVLVRPNKDIAFLVGFGAGTPAAVSGNLRVLLKLGTPEAPIVVIGRPDSSRLEFGGVSTEGGTRFHSGGKFEVFTELTLQDGRIVIKPAPEEKDGFLAKLLPADGMQIKVDLVIGFSSTQGLYFGGSSGLEVRLPAHVQLGPIEIVSALLAVRFKDGAVPVELAATVKGDLSVLKATVENIGLTAKFTFPPDRKGNLGPVDLALGFRPPNGVGLLVDAGVVKGGGYLFLDFDKGEYAGALELTIADFLSVKAIGLINTKLPGGQPGFSLLIILNAEFVPGIQLGYGFALVGVGGLLGLNRTVLLDALAVAVRTGAANNILFPTDVVANAPKILSDLRAIFPPHEGRFLIGPMAKIGWGTPTLVSVSLGVVIEIPGNVAILGRLRVNLPTENEPVLLLQVTFLGAIEFDKRRIWFFASLYESRILFITLDGEMGLLMDFGDSPNFVLSVGGFHPRFAAPALPFPLPRRIALNIVNERFARIRAEGYFALTSNSVQFGARAELFFGFDALSVEGYLVFDALLRFSPLYFEVQIASGFSVKVFGLGVWGVHLRGLLAGPRPWRVRGSASIELLFFEIAVDVDVTFGEAGGESLPPIALMPLVRAEFEKPQNWIAALPPAANLLVSLRPLDDPNLLVLHPVGRLRIAQRFAPLNVALAKIGNQKVADVKQLAVEVTAGPLAVHGAAREPFARAQYQELSDADKLSTPAFEPLDAGVELVAAATPWATGHGAERSVRYEAIVVDTLFERYRRPFFRFWGRLFEHFRGGAAISRSALSQAVEKKKRPFDERIGIAGDHYVVAFAKDNTNFAGARVFGSYAEAEQHLASAVAADPALGDQIHVIPKTELAEA